ncbi:MAG: efflux RND transporter periplasmic adaptor subunit [Pseudomonadota bacterium]
MSRIFAIALPILILVILGGGGIAALGALKPEPEKADEAVAGLSVFSEAVVRDDLVLTVRAQGEVRPKREISVSPQIAGLVSYVSPDFIDGGFIQRGQVLIRLETADYELGVTRARSAVASAEQALAREIAEAEIARQDIAELGIVDASPLARREPQLAQAQASLESAKAQLQEAELALERTDIRAPFSGRVRQRAANLGQFASPGQSLGSIFATDVVEVALPMDDVEMGRLGLPFAFAATAANPGPAVEFSANVAGARRTWIGEVKRTAASVNSQTRLINVIAELEDPYGEGAADGVPMAPGLFVDAAIDGATVPGVFSAPRAALRGSDTVYFGDPKTGTLHVRTVNVVYSDETGVYFTNLEGTEGLIETGDLAIVSPIQAAFDGMSIKVIERMPDGTLVTHETDAPPEVEDETLAATAGDAEGATQ